MSDETIEQLCPQCRELARQFASPASPTHSPTDDLLSLAADPVGHRRKYSCDNCQSQWESVELPLAFVDELRATRKSLLDAQRRVAMLRLLLASERKHHDSSASAPELNIVRAA